MVLYCSECEEYMDEWSGNRRKINIIFFILLVPSRELELESY